MKTANTPKEITMGRGGRRRTLPTSPLHPGGPALVGLRGRGFDLSLMKLPVTVTIDPARPGESLREETERGLVAAVEDDEPN